MVELADDAGKVSHAIVVGVEERRWPDLVSDGIFPPGVVAGHGSGVQIDCGWALGLERLVSNA